MRAIGLNFQELFSMRLFSKISTILIFSPIVSRKERMELEESS